MTEQIIFVLVVVAGVYLEYRWRTKTIKRIEELEKQVNNLKKPFQNGSKQILHG